MTNNKKITPKKITAQKISEKVKLSQKKEVIDKLSKGKSNLKILFAAAECLPFVATGGLGDVAGSLPQEIKKTGADIRVILPLYLDIANSIKEKLTFICSINVELSWRKQYCGIFYYEKNDVIYYFIDNEYYFKRHGIYGHYDDGERFAFFSKCVIDILKTIDYIPNIIHCNDWHTALIPVYLKALYFNDSILNKIKTVFTIHNIEYQGKFCADILEDILALPKRFYNLVEYEDNINLIKGAIQCCDMVTTVSPTYANEILTPYHSHGLHYILKENKIKVKGILNGIDYDVYNPKTDSSIFKNYDINNLEDKVINKTELQKLLNLPIDKNIPMIAVITRLVSHKGVDLIKEKIEDILKEKVQFVILGKGEIYYENMFLELQKTYSKKLGVIIAYNPDLAKKIYAGADLFLMPSKSEPCGLAQMIASKYATVPIVRETGGLADSIKDYGLKDGNGFTFADFNANDMYNRVIFGINLYNDKEKWKELIKRVINIDFTWKKSAKNYVQLYKDILS